MQPTLGALCKTWIVWGVYFGVVLESSFGGLHGFNVGSDTKNLWLGEETSARAQA